MKTILLFVTVMIFSIMMYNAYAESSITPENDFRVGTAEWIGSCNMVGSASTVKITDYDMNKYPEKMEQFDIVVWSDSDNRTISYTVVETGNDTGIFNSDVFFTSYDGSPGKRIRAFPDDIVYVKYVDYTLPNGDKEIEVIDTFVMLELSILEWRDSNPWKLAYDPCTIEFLDKNEYGLDQFDIFYPAPLKQIHSGIQIYEIKCKEKLIQIQKYDGSPACVKPETKQKLIERGWANNDYVKLRHPPGSLRVPEEVISIVVNDNDDSPVIPINRGETKEIDVWIEPKIPIISSSISLESYFGSACDSQNTESYCPGKNIVFELSDKLITSPKMITLTVITQNNMTVGQYGYKIVTKTTFDSPYYDDPINVGQSARFDLLVQ